MSFLFFLFAATAPLGPAAAPAALPAVVQLDPAQEARANALEMEIRCVVCQNEPIAQSTAYLAADMRTLVRERVAAGDTDEQIRAFFRARYGDFVLLRPPFDPRTSLASALRKSRLRPARVRRSVVVSAAPERHCAHDPR